MKRYTRNLITLRKKAIEEQEEAIKLHYAVCKLFWIKGLN